MRVGHHALLAHGRAVQVIRARAKADAQVGWAPVPKICIPDTEGEHDVAAARAETFSVCGERAMWSTTWWSDPVHFGRYPEDGLAHFGADAPAVAEGDMDTICQPLDFFGLNVYYGDRVRAGAGGRAEVVERPTGSPVTSLGAPIVPETMYWGTRFCWERYGLPLIITENGMDQQDFPNVDGNVEDPQRIDFVRRYLRQLKRACNEGIPIQGYFHWSIMDNFEWIHGYKPRLGLVYVDYVTQQRTVKDSGRWYAEVIRTNGGNL